MENIVSSQRQDTGKDPVAVEPHLAYALSAPASAEGRAFNLAPMERLRVVKQGLPARTVQDMSAAMGVSREQFMRAVGLARSTVERKIANRRKLSAAESEKPVGLSRLIGQVAAMVRESGSPPADFDPARWFARWMTEPAAALGSACSQELLATADDLTGTGAKRFGGRWNRRGTPMVYASGSRALTCLETVVHLGRTPALPPGA